MGMNWTDPAVIAETNSVFGSFSLVLTGVAIWDVLSTLWFEWQVISGKRPFRWPMIIYEAARISMLLHVFAIMINRNALHKVPCAQLAFVAKFFDALGTCMSSLILVLRTRAVWHRSNTVTGLLGLLFIGQIALWSQTFRYSGTMWNPTRKVCDVTSTRPRAVMVSVWAYTMVFDFIVLVLCSYQLAAHRSNTLGNILLRDGISYFCFVFGANLAQTIMAGLQLNPVMNILTVPFTAVVSVIAATTVFRNVFTASDSFAGESNGPVEGIGPSSELESFHIRPGSHIVFNHNTSTRQVLSANEVTPVEYKSTHDTGSVACSVDVRVDRV